MSVDLDSVAQGLVGTSVPRPPGQGAIAGHAAGEPFDKFMTDQIRATFPHRTFRHYELLNEVFSSNPEATTLEERLDLLGPPALRNMLRRGASAIRNWSPNDLFEEKQNDTADVIVLPTESLDLDQGPVHLVDAKTFQERLQGQPPNIISATKVASMCKDMFDFGDFGCLDLNYLGVSWVLEDEHLVVTDAIAVNLFKEEPSDLYINWAAATQLQFHPHSCLQGFTGSVEAWCQNYLRMFVDSARNRVTRMEQKYVEDYLPYI